MLYKSKTFELLELLDIVVVCVMSIVYGPKWSFYSFWDYIALFVIGICRYCTWVELSVQRRLCPIF